MRLERVMKRFLLGLVLVLLAAAAPAFATEFHGQVTFGGLPVPGAQATVTTMQGDKTVSAITDDQGLFTFPDLTDGAWTLSISMTGFAPVKQQITVAAGAPTPVFELKLMTLEQIRAADKPVVVQPGAAPAVENATSSAPTAGGDAGKAAAAGGKPAAAKGQTQQAGAAAPEAPPPPPAQEAASNDGFLINGSVNNAATSQFSLSQAFGNARNRRSLYNWGLVLRLENGALNARPYSIAGTEQAKPQFNNFTAGVNFGGPLKIPHLLPLARAPYFFIFYNRTQNATVSTLQGLVPTTAEEAGDLSGFGAGVTAYAPTSGLVAGCSVAPGAPFPSNANGQFIPASCISPVAQALMQFYPAPNVTGGTRYNYQIPVASGLHQDSGQAQLQKQLGNKNNVSGNVTYSSSRQSSPNFFGFVDPQDTKNIGVTAKWDHRITQRLFGNVTYNFSRTHNTTEIFFENKQNVSQNAGITGNDQDPANWGPPALNFGTSTLQGLSDGSSRNNRNETNSVSVNISWNRFRHNMQFGGDFRRQEFNYYQQSNPRGTLSFTGAATAGGAPNGGSDFGDFLLGLPDTSRIAYGNADKYLRQSVYGLFFNDDFRVSPELSIKYTVHWEYGAPMTELKNRLVNLDFAPGFAAETPVLASNPVGALSGQRYPTSLMRPDKTGIAPTVGIAWRPISGSSLLVRAGFGIYHDTSVYQDITYAMSQQSPLSTSLSVPNSATCRYTIASPFAALPCATTVPNTFAVDPNFRVGYTESWTASVQRDLPAALQMIVTYTGIKGVHGVQEILPNTYPVAAPLVDPCPSCPKGYDYRTSNGSSQYESGAVQLRRRLRAGFQANLNYTFAKSLDDDYSYGGQQGSVASGGSPQVAQDWRHPEAQRGLSTFDQRHKLALLLQYTTGMGLGGHALMSGWRGAIYKEWTVLTNISFGSGLPETPIVPIAVPGSAYTNVVRANFNGGAVHLFDPVHRTYLNAGAFAAPTSGFGTAGRNSITGPSQFSLDASMNRGFRVRDRYNLTAQIDATNLLNHATYNSYVTTLGSQFGAVGGVGQMRTLSITLRLRH
jgi:hypothetical protein